MNTDKCYKPKIVTLKSATIFLFTLDITKKMLYNMPMKKYIIFMIFGVLIFIGAYQCPLYNFLGVPCPSCGMTRAYKLFFTGTFMEAFLMHPLFLLPPLFFIKPLWKKPIIVSTVAIFIIVYIIRLAVLFPHTPPMNFNYNSILGEFLR